MPSWGRNIILIIAMLMVSCSSPPEIFTPTQDTSISILEAVKDPLGAPESSNLTTVEKRSRTGAVKVSRPFENGHGSGTYMTMYGQFVVVTAAHVVEGHTVMHIQERDGSFAIGRLIYTSPTADLAVLHVPPLKTRIAVPYRPKKNTTNLLGAPISYTGFPGHHDLITIRGHVASLEHNMIVSNMFGWFGSSGSGVFDRQGRFLGVVSGIDVGRWNVPIPLDSIVWVAPAWNFDEELLEIRVKTAPPLSSFNSFPGARAPRRGGVRD